MFLKASRPARDHEEVLREADLNWIMREAYLAHIVVPAFNIAYLPMVEPVVSAAKELDCFCLIEVARPDVEKFGAQSFSAVKQEYDRHAERAYIRLHQDHVPVIDEDGERVNWRDMIQDALNLGFDSVMIDGSRLTLKENIEVTRTVVEMAHEKGIPVEAELGAVYGHERGPLPSYKELFRTGKGFTDPEEAGRFVKETGLDWLSVAIGNIHGAISGAAKDEKKISARLNIEHLRRLVSVTGVPIVLHGGSGITRESVLDAIGNGVAKINVGTAIRQEYERALREKGSVGFAQLRVREKVKWLISRYYNIQKCKETGVADK
ncbi:MAG: class II fructose-bisphosphate aldolase [Candidatus Bathyarchaeia archaeon]